MLELRMASVVHSLVILLGSLFKQHFSDVIIDLYWLYVFQMLKLDLCDSPRGFGDWIPLLSLIWRSVRGIELPDQARTSASSSLRLLQCHGSSYGRIEGEKTRERFRSFARSRDRRRDRVELKRNLSSCSAGTRMGIAMAPTMRRVACVLARTPHPPTRSRVLARVRRRAGAGNGELLENSAQLSAPPGARSPARCMMMALDDDDGFHGGPTGARRRGGVCALGAGGRLSRVTVFQSRILPSWDCDCASYEGATHLCHDSIRCFGRARININICPPIQ
jgi:hypothetical protein